MISLGQAVEVEVVRRYENGGGLVRLPVLVESEIDLSRTAKGGKGTLSITRGTLDEIVANFSRWNAPVPVTVSPHREMEETAGPMPGFIESMKCRKDKLWADIDLSPWLFDLVVEQRSFRGFSVDIAKNPGRPTVDIEGWAVLGGVFTNRPAADVNFKVAAEAGGISVTVPLQNALRGKEEPKMSEEKTISLASHEAKVSEIKAELTSANEKTLALEGQLEAAKQKARDLSNERDEANSKLSALETDHAALRGSAAVSASQATSLKAANKVLESKVVELSEKLGEIEDESLSIKVRKLIEDAIDAGVAPAVFEGFEADPATWMKSKYASLESFTEVVNALSGVAPKKSKPVKSGSDLIPSDPNANPLTAEQAAKLRRLGLDPKYAGVTNENQVLEMRTTADKE